MGRVLFSLHWGLQALQKAPYLREQQTSFRLEGSRISHQVTLQWRNQNIQLEKIVQSFSSCF